MSEIPEEAKLTDEEIIKNREHHFNRHTDVLPIGITKLERIAADAAAEKAYNFKLSPEHLRGEIAKIGQSYWGYVDWEVETKDSIKHWYEMAASILALLPDVRKQTWAWYIIDEIAVLHTATHTGSKNQPCSICDRAEEAMNLLEKPSPEECKELYRERGTP